MERLLGAMHITNNTEEEKTKRFESRERQSWTRVEASLTQCFTPLA